MDHGTAESMSRGVSCVDETKAVTFTARNGMKSVQILTLITLVEGPGDLER